MRRAVALAALTICLLTGMPALAQDQYPARPIKLLVPFPAGGPVDVMGRLVAQHLSTALGQQVIVENRPGAGATLGGKAVATAEPDGYTLMVGSAATYAIGPTLYAGINSPMMRERFKQLGAISSLAPSPIPAGRRTSPPSL